jgi:PPOX class probable F420-dependent enzyme
MRSLARERPVRDTRGVPVSLSLLDPSRDVDARALQRLDEERLIWIGTVGPDGFPHAVPVWFLVHDDRILVLSEPKTAKVRNIRANSHALLHLEAGDDGEKLTLLQGTATVSETPTPEWLSAIGAAYATKYERGLAGLGLTVETMAERYSVVIEFVPVKLIAW